MNNVTPDMLRKLFLKSNLSDLFLKLEEVDMRRIHGIINAATWDHAGSPKPLSVMATVFASEGVSYAKADLRTNLIAIFVRDCGKEWLKGMYPESDWVKVAGSSKTKLEVAEIALTDAFA